MATAGPDLPPHLLAKRKRQQEGDEETRVPSPQPQLPSSPASPSSSNHDDTKRRRTIGPAPPPAPLSEKPPGTLSPPSPNDSPNGNPTSDNDSSDDDFGPSLPPANPTNNAIPLSSHDNIESEAPPSKPQREEWMLVPPQQADWSSRMDPTKLRARKFNTGKGAKAASSGGPRNEMNTIWTETPEQKRQRLNDEMMGVKKPAQLASGNDDVHGQLSSKEDEETRRKIRAFVEKERGQSLVKDYSKGEKREKEDDPSARAFDREKDMGSAVKIGHKKRREMMRKAEGFGDRFAGGKYL